VCSEKEAERRVNACCQIERDREGGGQTRRGLGGGEGGEAFERLEGT